MTSWILYWRRRRGGAARHLLHRVAADLLDRVRLRPRSAQCALARALFGAAVERRDFMFVFVIRLARRAQPIRPSRSDLSPFVGSSWQSDGRFVGCSRSKRAGTAYPEAPGGLSGGGSAPSLDRARHSRGASVVRADSLPVRHSRGAESASMPPAPVEVAIVSSANPFFTELIGRRRFRNGLPIRRAHFRLRRGRRWRPATPLAFGLLVVVAMRAGFFFEQRLTVGDRNLVIVGMNFGEGEEAVAIAAVVDEGRLERRLYAGDLGKIDVAAQRFLVGRIRNRIPRPGYPVERPPGSLPGGRRR